MGRERKKKHNGEILPVCVCSTRAVTNHPNLVSRGHRQIGGGCQHDVSAVVWWQMSPSPDYEASLKKEGGIPDGPVLESLLAGETLDKKVETKEEEPMSECQVRCLRFLSLFSTVLCAFSCLFSFYVWLSISFYLSVSPSVCVSLSVTAFVCLCFGGGTGSRGSDNFLLAPHVCVLVIVCDCAAASRCFTTIPVTWFTELYLWVRLLKAVWEKPPPPTSLLFAPPLHSTLCSVLQRDASLTAVCHLRRSSFSVTE